MSLHTLNLLHENSSTNSNLTSIYTHYPIATVNGISKLLNIYNNKINQQQNGITDVNTQNNSDQEIDITSNNPSTELPLTSILDKQILNSEKLSNEPSGHTLINKTQDFVRILFQNINGLELFSTGYT